MSPNVLAPPTGPGALAVIFTSLRTAGDDGYAQSSDEMVRLAAGRDGFLGMESARGADGLGITVSYWRDETAIQAWKAQADHLAVQAAGKGRWYRAYRVRVCRVEREYGFEAPAPTPSPPSAPPAPPSPAG
jgi:heme-degrading monooxygenase HmoA